MFKVFNLSVIELFLIQVILYSLLWLWDDYIASYLTIVFPLIFLAILIITGIVELIEPSKVPGKYYRVMFASVLAPVFVGALFYFIFGGDFDWLKGI